MSAPEFFPVHAAGFRAFVLNGEGRLHVHALTQCPGLPPPDRLAVLSETFIRSLLATAANDIN